MKKGTILSGDDAGFSFCGKYRYWLTRQVGWDEVGTRCLFILCNPSTADASQNDPTIRKCLHYAKAWRHDWLDVVNLAPLITPDPHIMAQHYQNKPNSIKPWSDDVHLCAIQDFIEDADLVVLGWGLPGSDPWLQPMRDFVFDHQQPDKQLMCLDTNNNGSPRHPLYLKKTLRPQPYQD